MTQLPDEERRYVVRSQENRSFWTGTTQDHRHVLIGLRFPLITAIFFDDKGEFIDYRQQAIPEWIQQSANWYSSTKARAEIEEQIDEWKEKLGFTDAPIRIRHFFLPDLVVGIQSFPDTFADVLAHPDKYQQSEIDIVAGEAERWKQQGLFVLLWNKDYWMDANGDVASS